MAPKTITCVDTFPLNPNGKIDRKALMLMQSSDAITSRVSRNTEEQIILGLWREILDLGDIEVTSNFFTIGGDSLKLIELHRCLQKQFNKPVKITDLFINPTIELQANLILK